MIRRIFYLMLLGMLSTNVIQAQLYLNAQLPIDKRVKSLMSHMTLEEKIAQMDMFAVWDLDKYKSTTLINKEGVGAFIGDVTPEQYNEIQALSEKTRLKIPFLVGVDAAHGHALMSGRTVFPTSISMAATFNPKLVYQAAHYSAKEIRACGNQWTFAPCIDIVHDARFGRTGETYGECPFLASALVRKAVQGLQGSDKPQERVAACAKHLLGGGASIGGVNHGNAEISERMMRRDFLPPFKAAIEEEVMTIMPGHNDVNGIPMHASKWILTDIIKNEYGFRGFFITDMGDIENLLSERIHRTAANQKDAVRQSINAGIDMHMFSWDRTMFVDNMMALVREGKISVKRIDDAVKRILTVKFQLGLFEERYLKIDPEKQMYATAEAKNIALEAARQSIVLLKNQKGLLPLDMSCYNKILVTGPNADSQAVLGDWSGTQPEEHVVTILDGIRQVLGNNCEVTYSPCGRIKGKKSDLTVSTTDPVTQAKRLEEGGELDEFAISEAVRCARENDLAIVAIGGHGLRSDWGLRTYGESADRPSIDFYGKQVELVQRIYETGVPTIVLIVNGKPLNNPWITEHISTIVDLWEPGMYAGQALAEILLGKVNPSGKLPITIPQTAGHIPQYYYQTKSRYTTGYGLGSSSKDDRPAFCFGHGLSYSSFVYGKVCLSDTLLHSNESLKIKVEVTNESKYGGYETVLVFVKDEISSVVTPLKKMKAFQKVFLKPGETKEVTLEIPFLEFGLWNADMKYVVEPGEFELQIGRSAEDIRLTKKIQIK